MSQQNRTTGNSTWQAATYLNSFALTAADASLRQSLTKIFGNSPELSGNRRLTIFAHGRHAAVASFACGDVDRDLTEQRDTQPFRFALAAAASKDLVCRLLLEKKKISGTIPARPR